MELMAEWQWKRWDAVARLGAGKLTLQEAARVLRLSVRQVRHRPSRLPRVGVLDRHAEGRDREARVVGVRPGDVDADAAGSHHQEPEATPTRARGTAAGHHRAPARGQAPRLPVDLLAGASRGGDVASPGMDAGSYLRAWQDVGDRLPEGWHPSR